MNTSDFSNTSKRIDISVTVPMLQAKYIGWLVLESLARQQEVNFGWELIIAEEIEHDPMGWDEISTYTSRLKQAGCVDIRYIALDEWIPLGTKVTNLIRSMHPEASIWMNVDADQYLPPLYLKRAWSAILQDGTDCYITPKWILYEIVTERSHLYDVTDMPMRYDQPVVTIRREFAEQIDLTDSLNCGPRILERGKQYQGRNRIVRFDTSDNWKYGLNTTGFNTCTTARPFSGTDPPYYPCNVDITETIPAEVLQQLKDSKQYLGKIYGCGLHSDLYEGWVKKNR